APDNPLWYANLLANPGIEVQDGPMRKAATARELHGDERARWWDRAVAAFPDYAAYQQRTDREIPVFVLEESAHRGEPLLDLLDVRGGMSGRGIDEQLQRRVPALGVHAVPGPRSGRRVAQQHEVAHPHRLERGEHLGEVRVRQRGEGHLVVTGQRRHV